MLLLFALAVSAEPSAAQKPQVKGNRFAALVTSSDYPEMALRLNQQGSVMARLSVDATGRVTGCEIVESSSSPYLDEATCKALSKRARFAPARDAAGKPVADTYTQRVNWLLPTGLPPMMRASWQIDFDAQSKPVKCSMTDANYRTIEDCAKVVPSVQAAWVVMRRGSFPASTTVGFVEQFIPGKHAPIRPSTEGAGAVVAHDSMKVEIRANGSLGPCTLELVVPANTIRRCAPPSAFKRAADKSNRRLFEEAHFSRTIWVAGIDPK